MTERNPDQLSIVVPPSPLERAIDLTSRAINLVSHIPGVSGLLDVTLGPDVRHQQKVVDLAQRRQAKLDTVYYNEY